MKALSVKQPFINLIAQGRKPIETRTWNTNHSGDLLLVASQEMHTGDLLLDGADVECRWLIRDWIVEGVAIPQGKAVCVARLVDCRPMTWEDEELACCRLYGGAWAWVLEDIRPVAPFEVKGQLGLYEVGDESILYPGGYWKIKI